MTIKKKNKNKKGWKYLFIVILILVVLNVLVFVVNNKDKSSTEKENKILNILNETNVKLSIPAVDKDNNGVSTVLNVEIKNGTGRTLVDIDSLLFWADTQQSIRIAKMVAENITGINSGKYDLVYSIEANASLIGGPSAGAALTLATIFALTGQDYRKNVMITGTINHDGTIGPVDGIFEKAKAAKSAGASTFIVPLLQSRDVVYETSEHCETWGSSEVCTSETTPKKINVAEESGVNIVEAENIEQALGYFKVLLFLIKFQI